MSPREEPHNATCDRCGGLLARAHTPTGHSPTIVTLDAAPTPDGAYRAWNRGDLWVAQPHDTHHLFTGMRRRLHVCVLPDVQLDITAA